MVSPIIRTVVRKSPTFPMAAKPPIRGAKQLPREDQCFVGSFAAATPSILQQRPFQGSLASANPLIVMPPPIPLEEPLPNMLPGRRPAPFDLARYFRELPVTSAQHGITPLHRLMFVVEKRSPQEPMRIAYQQVPNQQHNQLAELNVPSNFRWGGQLVLTEPHTEATPPAISIWPLSSTYRQLIPPEHLPELFDRFNHDLALLTHVRERRLKIILPTNNDILPRPFNATAFKQYKRAFTRLLTAHYPYL